MNRTLMARAIGAAIPCLLAAALGAGEARAAVGSTEASYGVTQNGAAVYTIPIRVTDGINGLTPELAISYAGPGTRTYLGVGFELTGISMIRPCARTIAQDLAAAPVTLTSSDRYCLDGARLRLLSGTGSYGASESQYRTELDQLIRITAKESSNGIPGWFRAETPDGLIYDYGSTADSKLLASGASGAPPQFWAIKRITDRSDNEIFFHYDTDNALRRFRPSYVSYTERGGVGHYRVDFIYQAATQPEPATEFTPSSTGGAAHSEDKLLERIELTHDATLYRKILLSYQSGAANNQRLASVQECPPGTPDECLPATTFTWVSPTSGHGSPVPSSAVASGVMPLDINGDGIEDLAWAASGTWRYMLGSASGYGSVQYTGITATNPTKAMPLEWNGDGFWDLLVDWSDGKWRVIRGSASGLLTTVVHAGPSPGIPSNAANTSWSINDMNGDGLDDLLRMQLNANFSIGLRLNGPTGFGGEGTAYMQLLMRTTSQGFIRMDGASAIRRPDFNGDRRGDLLVYGCEWDAESRTCYSYGWYQLISYGTTLVNQGMLPYASYTIGARFADFNADGLTDVVYPVQSPATWKIGFGQGGGGLAIVAGPSSIGYTNYQTLTGDYDGDGFHDFYAATSSAPQWHVFRASPTGFASSPILSGISATGNGWMLTDQNGDGLADLGRYDLSTLVWSALAHAGVSGERLGSATDGLGNKVSFNYAPMTDSAVYTKGSGAAFPVIDVKYNTALVQSLQIEPAGGAPYFFSYKYADARTHTQGRGFLGMGRREITDSRNGLFTVETYNQTFPYIGAIASVAAKQSTNGSTIQSTTHSYLNHQLDATSGNQRYLPYRSQTLTSAYEVGGVKNGNLISEITETHTVNTWGNSTLIVIEAKDKDTGSPEFNSVYRTEIASTFTENAANWCPALPLTRSEQRLLPNAMSETRSMAWQADTLECRITQETLAPGAGSLHSLVTDLDYDGCGNLDSISSYPADLPTQARTTALNYGTRCQRPESITNAENHTSGIAYDWALALPTAVTDPNEIETTFHYDGFGRLTRRDHPDGTDVLFTLGACTAGNGWCGKDSTVRLRATQSFRDTLNAVIRSEELFLDGFGRARWLHSDSLESGPAMIQTTFDAFGRPSARSQPYYAGTTVYPTSFARDLIGRVTQINAPISESQTSGRITGFAYEGRDLKVTDPKGNTTTRRSNVIGQLRAVIDPTPGGTTSYGYTPFAELASITDAANNATSWEYTTRGLVKKTTDPDSGIWEYEHNAFGELEKIRDAKTLSPAWSTQFTFDDIGRPLTRSEAEGTTNWNWGQLSDNTLDNKYIGRLKQITSPGSYAEIYTFDELGRLEQQRVDADGGSYYFNLTYAPATGLLDRLKYPISTGGEAGRFEIQHQYANGLLKRVQQYGGGIVFWEAISTDAWGRYQDETFGNGVQTFTDFDQASGLMESRYGEKGAAVLIHSQVNWDLNGNLQSRQDLKLSPQVTETFEYDALDRFDRSLRNGAQNFDVALNAIGNLSSRQVNADPAQAYDYTNPQAGCSYYSHAQPRAVRKVGTTVYCYDPNGNMTKRAGSAISYSSYNLPTVINAPGNYSSTISYGAFRNRYKQVAIGPQGNETTIYVAGLLEKVTNGSGTNYRHLIQGGQGTAAIHSRTVGGSSATFYLHRDHLGSPELITDSSGNSLVRPSFAAYGERRDGFDWDGAIGSGDLNTLAGITRRGFTGHEHLDAVGLIHMNGRVYEPVAGRFLGVDPIVHLGASQSPNSYGYVWNNPLTNIDPSGFDHCDATERCRHDVDGPPRRRNPDVFGPSVWDALEERNAAHADFQERRAARLIAAIIGSSDLRIVGTEVRHGVPADQLGADLSAGEIAHEGAKLIWPGYDLGTCINADEDCSKTDWSLAIIGVVPGGKGATILGKIAINAGGDLLARLAARAIGHGHHAIPKFLGGNASQILSRLDPKIHGELHALLRENLRAAGIPLNVGGRGGSAADWARYMNANPGAQRRALDAVLDASRSIDARYGTSITQDVWQNVVNGNFMSFP